MLKQSQELVSRKDGSIVRKTVFQSGPVQECTNCPCWHFDVAHGWESCCFYKSGLSMTGEFPKNCRVVALTVEELI